MKLSNVEVVADYREKLKALRAALQACGSTAGGKFNCKTWHMGTEFDFGQLVGRGRLKGEIAHMLSDEINETVRSLEAHGVVVDE